jgi:hypothetical protein
LACRFSGFGDPRFATELAALDDEAANHETCSMNQKQSNAMESNHDITAQKPIILMLAAIRTSIPMTVIN